MTADLILDGNSLGEQAVAALEPGEKTVIYNAQSIFTQTDTSLPPTPHELALNVGGVDAHGSFTGRNGVGCIVRGHLLEYVQEDQGLSVNDCTDQPFVDVNTYNPYCPAVTLAQDLGWVTGEADVGDINSNGDTSEMVMNTWTCANIASTSAVLMMAYALTETTEQPCPDVDPREWYAPYMNTIQAQTGLLADTDGNCNPSADLIRPKLEELLGAL